MKLIHLNILVDLSNAGIPFFNLAIMILIVAIGVAFAIDHEGKNKNFIRYTIWTLIVFSLLRAMASHYDKKWTEKSIEQLMKEQDQKSMENLKKQNH